MAWYGQKNYQDKVGNGPYTIAQIGCFVTSFCNLLEKFGTNIDPPSLNRLFTQRGVYLGDPADGAGVKDDLGWNSVTAYDGQVKVTATGGAGWPPSNNAIVKFAYKSPRTGAATTHFCLVADTLAHTIVDSWDGVVRMPGYYGTPVAWAEYANVVPEPVVVAPPSAPTPPAVPPSTADGPVINLPKGGTISSIAMQYGFTAQQLLDHNGLSWAQARVLPVGYAVHLPVKAATAPAPATTGYRIDILSAPKIYHVSKPGGAQKWGFANVKTWSDFVPNGIVAENTNVTVVAVATVLVGKESAAYYMDALAVGDYANNGGHVTNTIGLNWADVSEGEYKPAAPAAPPAITPAVPAEPPAAPEIDHPKPAPPVPDPKTTESPNQYKASYKGYPIPRLFVATDTIMCKEYDGRRPDHRLIKNQAVAIVGTFIYGQQLLGRPKGAAAAGYWFGVPMDHLISEEELFSTKVTLPEKVASRFTLSTKEKIFVAFADFASWLTKLDTVLKRNKK